MPRTHVLPQRDRRSRGVSATEAEDVLTPPGHTAPCYSDGSQDARVYPGHLSWGAPKSILLGTHAQETLGRERAESGGCGLPGPMRAACVRSSVKATRPPQSGAVPLEHGGPPLPRSASQCFRITRQGAATPAATGQVPPGCVRHPPTCPCRGGSASSPRLGFCPQQPTWAP